MFPQASVCPRGDTPSQTPPLGRHPHLGKHLPLGRHPPLDRHPLGRPPPPLGRHPYTLQQKPPWADIPWVVTSCADTSWQTLPGRHPLARHPHADTPPGQTPPPRQTPPKTDTPLDRIPLSPEKAFNWNALLFVYFYAVFRNCSPNNRLASPFGVATPWEILDPLMI